MSLELLTMRGQFNTPVPILGWIWKGLDCQIMLLLSFDGFHYNKVKELRVLVAKGLGRHLERWNAKVENRMKGGTFPSQDYC